MSPTDAKAMIEMLSILLIAIGFLFWRYGPCGHDECKRTHARVAGLEKEAEIRKRHGKHVEDQFISPTCRLCHDNEDRP